MIALNDINLSKIDLSGIDLRGIKLGLGGRGGSGDDSQRPWLFPDQAWTVAGKTNEDSNRDIIANVTGNGNDLKLTNFGFAEGSGYGLYRLNWLDKNMWYNYISNENRANGEIASGRIHITKIKNSASILETKLGFKSTEYKVRVKGVTENIFLKYVITLPSGNKIIEIKSDGIYTLPSDEYVGGYNMGWRIVAPSYPSECDITIEQIPEYEGYLVTDGVDDLVKSSGTFDLGQDWTLVGEWYFINTGSNDNSGIYKSTEFEIRNYQVNTVIKIKYGQDIVITDQNSVNAVCSDGTIYLKDWTKFIHDRQIGSQSRNTTLLIGSSGNNYTKIAFKNLALYNKVLSREDCIKAYDYLQTLKAK